jgi:hypothetical protein
MPCGSEKQKKELLPKIAGDELMATLALYEPDSGSDPDYIQLFDTNRTPIAACHEIVRQKKEIRD